MSSRVAMYVDGDDSRATCLCVVDEVPASFQIDCGSTFTQISPSLAPQRVPRFGLGSALCLGRRHWFPTCEVHLAPVDSNGRIVRNLYNGETKVAQVQIGALNLLGLRELRRWHVQMSFAPATATQCSVATASSSTAACSPRAALRSSECNLDTTVTLQDALQAAAALSNGDVAPEDARSENEPWLVDAIKVLRVLRCRDEVYSTPWWPTPSSPESTAPQAARVGGTGFAPDGMLALRAPSKVPRRSLFRLATDTGKAGSVLFGTADALLSHTIPPPLLPPPLIS